MRETFSILFYLKNYKKEMSVKLIYCRISINGSKAPFSTQLKINPNLWDQATNRAKGKSKSSIEINNVLSKLETRINDAYKTIKERRSRFDAFYLRDYIHGKIQNKENVSILTYFEQFLKEQNERVNIGDLSDETFKRYELTRDRLKDYMKEKYERDDMYLDEINISFARRFNLFIRGKYECGNNTAQKYVQKLKTVVTDAWGNGYLVADKLVRHKLKHDKHDPTCLTWNELKRIMQKTFYHARLERIRDFFVFACFTGLSYGDLKSLTTEDFELKNDENDWIDKDRGKTCVNAQILFSAIPHLIVEKYKNEHRGNELLPIRSCQKTNAYLKEIAVLCGINKNLTSHVARHTFATTVTLTEGVPLESVSKMLGHTNTVTTQIYAKVVNSKLRKDAAAWNAKMTGIENEFNLQNQ